MIRPSGVTLENWQVGPANRWAYRHVGELVPTAVVPRGRRHLHLPQRPSPLEDLPERPGPLEDLITDELLDANWVDGLAVLHHGVLVLERYRKGMGPASLHLSQSVAKSVLGLLVGTLCGRGALDPSDLVSAHVPEIASGGYAGATVGHLLDMTAAVDFVEDYAVDFWRYDVACGWHPPLPGAEITSILEYLPTIGPADRRHGEVMRYVTPNTDLLGIVAERAGGTPLAELLGRELWGPMGAEADAELTVDSGGSAAIGGGLCATLRDYARVGALVLSRGEVGDRSVTPERWVGRLGAGDPGAFERRVDPGAAPAMTGYGNHWWRAGGRVVARGIHGQLVSVDHEAGLVVALLSSWPEAMVPEADSWQRALAHRVSLRLA